MDLEPEFATVDLAYPARIDTEPLGVTRSWSNIVLQIGVEVGGAGSGTEVILSDWSPQFSVDI